MCQLQENSSPISYKFVLLKFFKVRDGCGELSATKARENAFEIIWAFEEVISSGMRENVTFRQVKDFLLMESQHEQREEEFIRVRELVIKIIVTFVRVIFHTCRK